MIVSAIGQGMLWALLGLGIFMTYRILNFPDMTTEGSFPLGGAVCVTAITTGVSPFVATLLGVGAGMLAGLVTVYKRKNSNYFSRNFSDVWFKFRDFICDEIAK